MVWQLLNKTATLAQGINDARFTRQFMVVVPGLIVYERLLDAFCGKLVAHELPHRLLFRIARWFPDRLGWSGLVQNFLHPFGVLSNYVATRMQSTFVAVDEGLTEENRLTL